MISAQCAMNLCCNMQDKVKHGRWTNTLVVDCTIVVLTCTFQHPFQTLWASSFGKLLVRDFHIQFLHPLSLTDASLLCHPVFMRKKGINIMPPIFLKKDESLWSSQYHWAMTKIILKSGFKYWAPHSFSCACLLTYSLPLQFILNSFMSTTLMGQTR